MTGATPGSFTAFHSKIFFLSSKFLLSGDILPFDSLALLISTTPMYRMDEKFKTNQFNKNTNSHLLLSIYRQLDCVHSFKTAIRINLSTFSDVGSSVFLVNMLAVSYLLSECLVTCHFLDNFPAGRQEFHLLFRLILYLFI